MNRFDSFVGEPPVWAAAYVGIPFHDLGREALTGLDCWGLVRLIFAEYRDILLPYYATNPDDLDAVHSEIEHAKLTGEWTRIQQGYEQEFDVVEMSMPARVGDTWEFPGLHVGVIIGNGWMLHIERATSSVLARYREDQAIKRRILAFWRHRKLMIDAP